jgi:hypothetical protein
MMNYGSSGVQEFRSFGSDTKTGFQNRLSLEGVSGSPLPVGYRVYTSLVWMLKPSQIPPSPP